MRVTTVRCKYCNKPIIFAKAHSCVEYLSIPKTISIRIKSGRINRKHF